MVAIVAQIVRYWGLATRKAVHARFQGMKVGLIDEINSSSVCEVYRERQFVVKMGTSLSDDSSVAAR
jgi:hypothetical protein